MSEINMSVPLALAIETAQDLMGERDEIIKMATARESVLNEQIAKLTKEHDACRSLFNNKDILISKQRHEIDVLRTRAEAAEAKCAEMRGVVENLRWVDWCMSNGETQLGHFETSNLSQEYITHALSDQCGEGWLSPEKKKVLVEALEDCIITFGFMNPETKDGKVCWDCRERGKKAIEACK